MSSFCCSDVVLDALRQICAFVAGVRKSVFSLGSDLVIMCLSSICDDGGLVSSGSS